MATGYPYEHVPINADKGEIRLLSVVVRRSFSDSLLKCSFKKLALPDESSAGYYAISYVWGSLDVRKDIVVDGHWVSVPHNAEEALRRLCQHKWKDHNLRTQPVSSEEILIWIDAVCVNQADLDERSWQVDLMGRIYSIAIEVLIWLGPGDRGANQSVAFVKKLGEHCRHETNNHKGLSDTIWALSDEDGHRNKRYGNVFQSAARPELQAHQSLGNRIPISDTEIESLKRFFSAPWFTQMWAIQEVVLAKKPVCYYGECSVPAWDVLIAAAWWEYGSNFWTQRDIGPIRGIRCAATICDMPNRTHLYEILQCVGEFDCSDLRDKLYAILHLMPPKVREEVDGYAPIDPDYTKSLNAVWTAATRAATLEGSTLNLLRKAGMYPSAPDKRFDRESLPSWVPSYHNTWSQSLFRADHDYRNFKGVMETDECLHNRDILSIKGTILGRVTQVGARNIDNPDWISIFHHLRHELTSVWRWVDTQVAPVDLESVTSAIGTIFTCGMRHRIANVTEEQFNESVVAFMQHLESQSSLTELAVANDRISKELPFFQAFYRFSRHRALFIAESGRVGMAPIGTEKDDTIVQLFGCEIPFILRQEGGYWTLLGDVYVHHLPDHIRDLQQSGQYPNPRFFNIR